MKHGDRSPLPEELSGDEFDAWLREAERDPARSAEIDFLADLTAAAALELGRPAAIPAPPRIVRRARRWLVPAAALVLVTAALALWLAGGRQAPRRASELAQRSAPRYVAVELRGAGDAAFAHAMEAYARGEWDAAAAELSAVDASDASAQSARFYLAAAREQMSDLDGATALWSEVVAQAGGVLGEHARWRLAQLYLAREQVPEARHALDELAALEGDFAARARELLADLDRL